MGEKSYLWFEIYWTAYELGLFTARFESTVTFLYP
jgi:hypothetical protein